MPSRDDMDSRIDAWKDQYKDLQKTWRTTSSTTGNYGQVLRNNGRPSDQTTDGPGLPANLRSDGWIDVYQSPEGFGWTGWFEATEGTDYYLKTVDVFEDGPFVIGEWILYPEGPVMSSVSFMTRTKNKALAVWEAIVRVVKKVMRRS